MFLSFSLRSLWSNMGFLIDYIYEPTWSMTIFLAKSFDRWATHSFLEASPNKQTKNLIQRRLSPICTYILLKIYIKLPSTILTIFIYVFLSNPHPQTLLFHGVVNMLKESAFCSLHLILEILILNYCMVLIQREMIIPWDFD